MDEQIKQKQQQRQQKSDGQILKELYGLVFIRGAEITPKKISNRYQRPISQANKLLEDFLSKYGHAQNNNNNKPLKVRYEFAGSKPKNGGVQNLDFVSHSLSLIDDTELELKKSAFESCSYRPVSVHLASKKSPDPVLFFTQIRSPAEPTIESLKKVQNLSNVLNPHIKIRPPFRPLTIKTAAADGKAGSKSKADDAIAAAAANKKPKPTTTTTGVPMDIDKPGPSTSTSYLTSTLLKPSKYFSSSSIGSSSSTSSAKQQQKATSSSTSSLLKKRPILEQPSSSKDDKDKESSSTSSANTFTALKASAPPAKKAKKGPAKSSKVLDSLADPCEKLRAEKRLTEQANFTVKKSGGGGGNALQTSTTSKPVNKKNGPTAEVVSTAGKSTGQQSILSFFARKKIN